MRNRFCNNKIGKIKSEKGFTLLELLMVTVVTGLISSSLVLPFASSINKATRPEIYNTATYIAVGELEKIRSDGHTAMKASIGSYVPLFPVVTKKGRDYNVAVVIEYVSYYDGSISNSATPTEFIRATVTITNSGMLSFSMSEILADDFYDPSI